jgi:uncharacterized protein YegJ (DUF2314 family)
MNFWKRLLGKQPAAAKTTSRERAEEPTVYDVKTEDTVMNLGIEKANQTLDFFKASLRNPALGQDYFSIKALVEDGNRAEHMWLTEPHFDGEGNLYGTVGNEPIDVRNVRLGEKIGVAPDKISDWMILTNGRLTGGYTIRAIRDGLEGGALRKFDASLGGIIVDEGEDHFPADRTTPEGAILALEAAYDAGDLDAVLACKDFKQEAILMAAGTGLPADEEIVASLAEVLETAFVARIKSDGMPNFSGLKKAFPLREKLGENHYLITEICRDDEGHRSINKLPVMKVGDEWIVLAPQG